MTLRGLRWLSHMPGGTQSHLMLGSDQEGWVVKFTNNPQHPRVLVNELVVGRIAHLMGLTVPRCAPIFVDRQTIAADPELRVHLENGTSEVCAEGLHFGSQYVGGSIGSCGNEEISLFQSGRVVNAAEFVGMFVVDRWTGNIDRRQTVYKALLDGRRIRAFFIDHGGCFGGSEWKLGGCVLPWGPCRSILCDPFFDWGSFEPWLRKVEAFPAEALWKIAGSVPPTWYRGQRGELEHLLQELLKRRSLIRWHTFNDWTSHRACVRDL